MNDAQIIWILMTAISFITGVLVLFVKADPVSLKKISWLGPMADMFRNAWWKYVVAGLCFCLSILSFFLYRGWIA